MKLKDHLPKNLIIFEIAESDQYDPDFKDIADACRMMLNCDLDTKGAFGINVKGDDFVNTAMIDFIDDINIFHRNLNKVALIQEILEDLVKNTENTFDLFAGDKEYESIM